MSDLDLSAAFRKIGELEHKLSESRLALRKYARHLDYCHLHRGDDCTCGLQEEFHRD